jgi:hypothetical protein
MRRLIMLFLLACCFMAGASDSIPTNAVKYLPALVSAQHTYWPTVPMPEFMAGQIEQESCVTLTSERCWDPRAELKTSREDGVGLGQFTRTYNSNGTIKYDLISQLAKQYPSLKGWSWSNRYDAHYQLIAFVEMDHDLFTRQTSAASDLDRISFTLSAYNGGEGGLLQDRRLCANTRGCNPNIWLGNVEKTSLKSKRAVSGYGSSFFTINRQYVANILNVRREKYKTYFGQK